MTVFTCVPEWEAMLSCVYTAWASKLGHQNIRLALEPVGQVSLFDTYIHVDADRSKAESVMDAVNIKISPQVYHELAYTSMAYEEDVLDNIYRVMILGFAFGPKVLEMVQYRDVMRNYEIRQRVGREAHSFREFLRFHAIGDFRSGHAVYVAHIEPKSRVIGALGEPFVDRMPSEHWMIVDDIHLETVVHPANEPYYFWRLTEEEFDRLKLTESVNDEFTDLWKIFFDSVAIEQRTNARCQNNHFPIWLRKHAVEFL